MVVYSRATKTKRKDYVLSLARICLTLSLQIGYLSERPISDKDIPCLFFSSISLSLSNASCDRCFIFIIQKAQSQSVVRQGRIV